MPRQGRDNRGGARAGTPGKAYPNRTDLNVIRQPVRTAPSKEYGSRVAQERAQQAMPVATPVAPAPGPTPNPGVRVPLPPPTPLSAPSERPDEPVTAGIDMGAGPGRAALGLAPPVDPDLLAFASYLPTLELLASQPDSTVAMRNFVRRLRGAMPNQRPV